MNELQLFVFKTDIIRLRVFSADEAGRVQRPQMWPGIGQQPALLMRTIVALALGSAGTVKTNSQIRTVIYK